MLQLLLSCWSLEKLPSEPGSKSELLSFLSMNPKEVTSTVQQMEWTCDRNWTCLQIFVNPRLWLADQLSDSIHLFRKQLNTSTSDTLIQWPRESRVTCSNWHLATVMTSPCSWSLWNNSQRCCLCVSTSLMAINMSSIYKTKINSNLWHTISIKHWNACVAFFRPKGVLRNSKTVKGELWLLFLGCRQSPPVSDGSHGQGKLLIKCSCKQAGRRNSGTRYLSAMVTSWRRL